MPLEKSLPKGCQRHWSLGQEHECNLGNSRIWVILDPWNKRSSPQQFFVTHIVDQAQRWLNPLIQTTRLLIITWLKIGIHCSHHTLNSKMLNRVYANDRKHNTDSKKQHKEPQWSQRLRLAASFLPLFKGHTPRLHLAYNYKSKPKKKKTESSMATTLLLLCKIRF